MGFTVDAAGCLRVRCIYQAENLPLTLVHPILEVIDPVFLLHFNIGGVSFRDIFRSRPVNLVDIHVQRHIDSNLARNETMQQIDFGRMSKRLVNDAISLCQTKEGSDLIFAGVGVQIELQANLLESDWHILRDAKRATKIEIALSAD